jgi:hypothetical protein
MLVESRRTCKTYRMTKTKLCFFLNPLRWRLIVPNGVSKFFPLRLCGEILRALTSCLANISQDFARGILLTRTATSDCQLNLSCSTEWAARANREKKQRDWLATNTDDITNQSHSLSIFSREKNHQMENGLRFSYIIIFFQYNPRSLKLILSHMLCGIDKEMAEDFYESLYICVRWEILC